MNAEPSNFDAVALHESAHFIVALHHEKVYGDQMPFQAVCVQPAPFHDMWIGVCYGWQPVAGIISQGHDSTLRWMITCAAGGAAEVAMLKHASEGTMEDYRMLTVVAASLHRMPYVDGAAYEDETQSNAIEDIYRQQREVVLQTKDQALMLVKQLEPQIRALTAALTTAPKHFLNTEQVRTLLASLS